MAISELSEWLVVIPARLGSQRLPRKPLADVAGKPLIVRVVENLAPLAEHGAHLVVATDHEDVLRACDSSGIAAQMTRDTHASGTDRCWEVASNYQRSFVLNVQGDEPFVRIGDLQRLCRRLMESPSADIATLAFEHTQPQPQAFASPHVVKVVLDRSGRALYFSRAGIPVDRDAAAPSQVAFWQHLGVYAFRRPALGQFCELPVGRLEALEKLEQLRALENGMQILVVSASQLSHGIDTPADLEAARAHF